MTPFVADIFYSFRLFGFVHAAVVVLILVAAWLVVVYRRRLPTDARRYRFDRILAIAGFALWIINQTTELAPSNFEIHRSLPLHLCDFTGLIAPLAILTSRRFWRALLYFWGIGLSTQALFTPELMEGLAQFNFWVFWVPHGMIVVLAIYDLAARQFRPGWKDFRTAAIALATLVAIVLPLNLWLGVNYIYVGKGVPGQPSVIDFLGPWPLRLVHLVAAVLLVFAIMTLPWEICRRRRERLMTAPVTSEIV